MTGLDVGIVVAYFAMIIGVGIYSSKRASTPDNYLVAGHRLGYGITFACLSAVLLGGASTIGTTALGYTYGISGIWLVAMLGLGLALVGILLIKRIRELNVLTVAELLTRRFGSKAGVLSALVSALYTMMVCATQVIAMGTILQGLAGWDPVTSMLVVGFIVVAYTILGGMWAITLTDFIQFILIVIGVMFVMLPNCVDAAGGFDALVATLPSSYFDITSIGWPTIIQYFFLYCLGALVGQDLWQRYLTAKSVKVARRSGIASGLFILLYAVACALIGMAAAVYMPGAENTQLVFATMANDVLPTGALGIVLVAVLAVLMSTASGTLLASSSLLANDVIKPLLESRRARTNSQEGGASATNGATLVEAGDAAGGAGEAASIAASPAGEAASADEASAMAAKRERPLLRTSRCVTAVVGILAIVVAVALNDVLAALDVSYAILSGALFFPVILGMFWKRATTRAALVSIAASTVVILVGLAIEGTSAVGPIVWGLVVSIVLMVGISLFDGKSRAVSER